MTWSLWKKTFEVAAQRPVPVISAPVVGAEVRLGVLGSLQKFQIGESGEGRVAHEIDSALLPGVDDEFRATLKMLVREEGRHSRILALMVRALGGQTLSRNWSERLFVHVRRAFGLRFKMMVLLSVEVIGIAWYGLLADQLPAGPFAEALRQMCSDEERHLAFFSRFFAAQQLWWVRVLWWPLNLAAGTLVILDHRRTLSALRVPWSRIASAMVQRISEASHRMREQVGAAPAGRAARFHSP